MAEHRSTLKNKIHTIAFESKTTELPNHKSCLNTIITNKKNKPEFFGGLIE